MNNLKNFLKIFFIFLLSLNTLFAGFFGTKSEPSSNTITIGVTAGPHVEVMEFVKKLAKEDGINLKIVEFNDFILPNVALANKELDLNSYQHLPFLEEQIKTRHYHLTSIGKTLLFPMRAYSEKIKSLSELKDKAHIVIPNDPSNGGRALLLLQDNGLIKLKDNSGFTPSILDIKENPKKFKITELEAPQVPRVIKDVDIVITSTDWAVVAGLDISKTTIAIESAESPYANIIVARIEDKDNPLYQKFVKIYQSNKTKEFVDNHFGDVALPAW